jgi:acetyl-CoA carboxylase biotin carboxylase subunit
MNTRVQVEHPITEMITGVDVVQAGILAAAGEPLPWRQRDITFSGHAIECRVVAEDPYTMLPSPGTIRGYHAPGGLGVRVDSGVAENSVIPVFYDSLVAKIVAHGKTRDEAIQRMRVALSEYQISGIKTNIALHQKVLQDPEFLAGDVHTRYLDKFIARPATRPAASASKRLVAVA